MINILHISNTDIVADSRIRKELVALVALPGTQISVVGVPESACKGDTQIDGVCYRQLALRSRSFKRFPRAIRYILELVEFTTLVVLFGRRAGAQVVHCHDTMALPAGWLLKMLVNSKLIYDAHELESNKNGQNIILSTATLLIEKFCWKRVDLLVSVSTSILNWYDKNLGPKQSVLVLNSPVYDSSKIVKFARGGDSYFVRKYGLPRNSPVFVYLGIIGPGRGIESCVEAFKEFGEHAHVVFIGFGRLEKVIEDAAKVHKNIHLHPAVEHDKVVPLVSNADYGLCFVENASLSDYLCLPNKLFEYSFAGLKILASDFPEIQATVKKFDLGICCEPTVEEIKRAVSSILASPPACPRRDISELSWDRQAQRLTEAYLTMLSNYSIKNRKY